jgi:hypothetical protein
MLLCPGSVRIALPCDCGVLYQDLQCFSAIKGFVIHFRNMLHQYGNDRSFDDASLHGDQSVCQQLLVERCKVVQDNTRLAKPVVEQPDGFLIGNAIDLDQTKKHP